MTQRVNPDARPEPGAGPGEPDPADSPGRGADSRGRGPGALGTTPGSPRPGQGPLGPPDGLGCGSLSPGGSPLPSAFDDVSPRQEHALPEASAGDPGLALGLTRGPGWRPWIRPILGLGLVLLGLLLWILPVVPGFVLSIVGAPMLLSLWPRREARFKRGMHAWLVQTRWGKALAERLKRRRSRPPTGDVAPRR